MDIIWIQRMIFLDAEIIYQDIVYIITNYMDILIIEKYWIFIQI